MEVKMEENQEKIGAVVENYTWVPLIKATRLLTRPRVQGF
jgi:hypothetical protein